MQNILINRRLLGLQTIKSPALYFGHPITEYGTEKEQELVQKIKEEFPEYNVYNPNKSINLENYKIWKQETGRGMNYYFNILLPEMLGGIFLPFKDGMFGAGVGGEAEFLLERNLPVWEINYSGKIKDIDLDAKRVLSIADTINRVHPK